MRGRKLNTEFLSDFISECAQNGLTNSDDILIAATEEISKIDTQLKQIDLLKKRRSQLFDVKLFLDKKVKNTNIDFFKVKDKILAKHILGVFDAKVQSQSTLVKKLSGYQTVDILHCINELISLKVIYKIDNEDILYLGVSYNDFLNFLSEHY